MTSGGICPACGRELSGLRDRCPDCDEALLSDPPEVTDPPVLGDDVEQAAFDLDDWTDGAIDAADKVLGFYSVDHRWTGTSVFVAVDDEDRARDLIQAVQDAQDRVAARDAGAATSDGQAGEGGSAHDHPIAEVDQIAYELDEWANESKVALKGMLDQAGVHHVWEAGTLVINAGDEQRVDALVEEIEVTQQPTLDPDADQVVYEIEGFDDAARTELERSLLADEVPHGWDEEGNLVVLEADEDAAAAILDRVDAARPSADDAAEVDAADGAAETDPDAGEGSDADLGGEDGGAEAEVDPDPDEGDEEDDLAAQEALSALYVATDKLVKSPYERREVAALGRASESIARLRVPYGFTTSTWTTIRREAAKLHDLLSEPVDELVGADRIEADTKAKTATRTLREILLQYV
jgi:hypothetical protein